MIILSLLPLLLISSLSFNFFEQIFKHLKFLHEIGRDAVATAGVSLSTRGEDTFRWDRRRMCRGPWSTATKPTLGAPPSRIRIQYCTKQYLDMSSSPCATPSDAQNLISLIRSLASHLSQFLYGPESKVFVSTFSVISHIFYWARWNSGWPTQLTTVTLANSASNPSALASLLNINVSAIISPAALIPSGLSKFSAFENPGDIYDTARSVFSAIAGAFTSDRQHLNAINTSTSRAVLGTTQMMNITSVDTSLPVRKTYVAAGEHTL
ncbi:glycoside hydrolase family 71 protein [Ramaria rubella]|nr:glycoside hydrolase family 71 protein [Ramaria rubella]